ncbi:hypothetical protein HUU53_03445 [Candidatus Micrarchaeota archaeon]|nr:hypothetical protein [Candidatus Micrarchaeota archaeon]
MKKLLLSIAIVLLLIPGINAFYPSGCTGSATLTIPAQGCTTTILDAAAKSAVCTGQGQPANCCLTIQITGEQRHEPGDLAACLTLDGVNNVRISCSTGAPIKIYDTDRVAGISVSNSNHIEINNCELSGSGVVAVPGSGVSSNAWDSAILIDKSTQVRIIDPYIHDLRYETLPAKPIAGIQVKNSNTVEVKRVSTSVNKGLIRNIRVGTSIYPILVLNTPNFLVSGVSAGNRFEIRDVQGTTNNIGVGVDSGSAPIIAPGAIASGTIQFMNIHDLWIRNNNLEGISIQKSGSVAVQNNIVSRLYSMQSNQFPDPTGPECIAPGARFDVCLKSAGEAGCFTDVGVFCHAYGIRLGLDGETISGDPNENPSADYQASNNQISLLYADEEAKGITGAGTIQGNTINDVGALRGIAYGIQAGGSFTDNTISKIVSAGTNSEAGFVPGEPYTVSKAEGLRMTICSGQKEVSNNAVNEVYSKGTAIGFRVSSTDACDVKDNNRVTGVYADAASGLAVGAFFDNLYGQISDVNVQSIAGLTSVGIGVAKTSETNPTTFAAGGSGLSVNNILASAAKTYTVGSTVYNFNPVTGAAYGLSIGFENPALIAKGVRLQNAVISVNNVNCRNGGTPTDKAVGIGFYGGSAGNTIVGNQVSDLSVSTITCNSGEGAYGVDVLNSNENQFSGVIDNIQSSVSSKGISLRNARNNVFDGFTISNVQSSSAKQAVFLGTNAGSNPSSTASIAESMKKHINYALNRQLYGYHNEFKSRYGSSTKSVINVASGVDHFFVQGNSFNDVVDVDFIPSRVGFHASANLATPPNHLLAVKKYADIQVRNYANNAFITSLTRFEINFAPLSGPWSWINNVVTSVRASGQNDYLIFDSNLGNAKPKNDVINLQNEVDVFWLVKQGLSDEFTPHKIRTTQVPAGFYGLPVVGLVPPSNWPNSDPTRTTYFVNTPPNDNPNSASWSTMFNDPAVSDRNLYAHYENRYASESTVLTLSLLPQGCGNNRIEGAEECDANPLYPSSYDVPASCTLGCNLYGSPNQCTCIAAGPTPTPTSTPTPTPGVPDYLVSVKTPEFSSSLQTELLAKFVDPETGLGVCFNPVGSSDASNVVGYGVRYDSTEYNNDPSCMRTIDLIDCNTVSSTPVDGVCVLGLYSTRDDPSSSFPVAGLVKCPTDPSTPISLCVDSCNLGEHVFKADTSNKGAYKIVFCTGSGPTQQESVSSISVDFKEVQTPELNPLLVIIIGLGVLFVSRKN